MRSLSVPLRIPLSLAALLAALSATFSVRAALLAHEPFDAPPGSAVLGSAGGVGFSAPWQTNSSVGVATNTAFALSYTDSVGNALTTTGGAAFFQGSTTASGAMQPVRPFAFSRGTNGVDGATTWVSFLIARLGPTGTLTGNPYGRGANVPHDLGTAQKLAIGNSSGAATNTVGLIPQGAAGNLVSSTNTFGGATNFVVVRIDHVTNGLDRAYLWVNPRLDLEPALADAGAVSSNAFDFSFDRLRVFAGGQSSAQQPYAELILDEYRVGESFADVAPHSPFTPPAPLALVITNFNVTPAATTVAGVGGTNGGWAQLLTSADLFASPATWAVAATHPFDAAGRFHLTNFAAPTDAARFFRVRAVPPPPPVPPFVLTQPASLVVTQGQTAWFAVSAGGTAPLGYQWFFNLTNALAAATNTTLVITNVQPADAGGYLALISNGAGAVTSAVATLTVLVPPTITTQPQSQTVTVSNNVTFSVAATGTAPLAYQWLFNTNTPLSGATNASLTLTNVQTNAAGAYRVVVTNAAGAVTSAVAVLTVQPAPTNGPDFSLYGFGAPTTGGGLLADTDPNYRKVYTPGDFRLALTSGTVKVIEIMNDLNLGWNEIGATNQTGRFRSSTAPSLHPVLLASGVTTVDIQDKNGLTIFSANGATIRRAEFNLKRAHNVIIRNLKFDELWEWDEATKGDYDAKDWDFITIGDGGNCTNVWIDHCTFTKSYDGTVDLKDGANHVTISWCRFLGDDGAPGGFVWQQFNYLETNNAVSKPMYSFLRSNGFSMNDIITIARSQKKGHLAGPTEFDPDNANIRLTLHHNYYLNHQDRLPRLRAGNAHVFNVYLNNTAARAAKLLRDAKVAAIPGGLGAYKFDVTLNGAISTEGGAVLVEKCHLIDLTAPLRNNQVSPTNAAYTGKIRAADTIHTLGASTFRGDTETPGSTLVPVPAPLLPFSWNGFAALPYSYPLRDPSELAALLTTGNTGAGTVTWAKTNWLKTLYP